MNKDIYANDLMHRFPGFSFTETAKGDLTIVALLDDQQIERAASTSEVLLDAYRTIRADILMGEKPIFLSSTAERDALTGLDMGVFIYNIDTGRNEAYDGTEWISAAGRGVMGNSAYGEIYQDHNAGNTIPGSGLWSTAKPGVFDENGIITFAANKMTVGSGGAGNYAVSFNLNFTSSAGENCAAFLHVDGVDIDKIKDSHPGDSAERGDLSATGILILAAGDTIELHVQSDEPTDNIKVYQVNLNIRRIS